MRILLALALTLTAHAGAAPVDGLGARLRTFAEAPVGSVLGQTLASPKQVARFYRARAGKAAWIAADGAAGLPARELLEAIREAANDGLSPREYHLDALEPAIRDAPLWVRAADATAADRVFAAEILLTDAFLTLADHLNAGRLDPATLSLDWAIRRRRADMVGELEGALVSGEIGETLRRLAPVDSRYVKLRAALAALRNGTTKGPVTQLIPQVEANLERLRWLPRELGGRYLFVDVAGFRLTAFENDRQIFATRIIVGDDYRRTPMMSAPLTTVIVNPYWTIPLRILVEEIAPRAKADPTFLNRRHILVYEDSGRVRREIPSADVDWTRVKSTGSPYLFLAHSGASNPLGNVKFVLRNDFQVYLHGTPDTKLFRQKRRALSHGCIRVENPVGLASVLMKGPATATSERSIRRLISEGLEHRLPLESPVPVHLWYRTVWVDRLGTLQSRPDIYGWDTIVSDALHGRKPIVTVPMQRVIRAFGGRRLSRLARRSR